jgi:uncharacterized protein YjiS (DUF1127 family)
MNLLESIQRIWAHHREFRAVYTELARLSDRELRDMGIARDDIARLAYAEAERRVATPTPNRAGASIPVQPAPVPTPGG